jgi:hypothetical protein
MIKELARMLFAGIGAAITTFTVNWFLVDLTHNLPKANPWDLFLLFITFNLTLLTATRIADVEEKIK